MSDTPIAGEIVWRDLTVSDPGPLKEFYADVVGWKFSEQSMGDYSDFNVEVPSSGEVVAGLCHARGINAGVPPQWLVYVAVGNVAASAAACVAHGGKVVDGPRDMGGSQFCVIQDPAGAVLALIQCVGDPS